MTKRHTSSPSTPGLNFFSAILDKNTLWVILFVLTVAFRLVHLSADPPIGLTTSQGVYTDPAAYTMYAKNASQFGAYNPLGDTRFPLFQYSAVTPVARAVFEIFGSGYAQANFSALLFSLASIFLLCLLVRRRHGPAAVFFMLLFLALNKNQFFYGRLPFLENPMVFFGLLSFWLAESYRGSRLIQALAGVALSASFLLGKSHGLVFVGVFSVFFVWRILSLTTKERALESRRIFAFGAGLLSGCLLWFLVVGWPNFGAISNYLAEQSTGLYGPPEAFDSVSNFFWKLFSLGIEAEGFAVVALVAFLAVSVVLFRLIVGKGSNESQPLSGVVIFMTFWVVLVWLELFAWNYRPLRYQVPLIYPLSALGGVVMATLWNWVKKRGLISGNEEQRHNSITPDSSRLKVFYLVFGFVLMFPVYQLWAHISLYQTDDFSFDDSIWSVVASAVIVWVLYIVVDQLWRRDRLFRMPLALMIAALIIAPGLSFASGVAWYADWMQRPTYTIVAVSHDLAKILGADAILSGPYGVGLCQENNLPALVHQFGVADPDTTFLDNFPVTHILLDESNMIRFQNMYPRVASRSFALHTYHVTNLKVSLLRIAGATKNTQASSYPLSAFEIGQLAFQGRIKDPTGRAVAEMMKIDSSNIAVNLYMARRAEQAGALKESEFFLECAAGASPTDYDIQAEVGRLNLALFNKTGVDMFRQRALERFKLANHLNPGAEKIAEKIEEVEALK